MAKYKIQSLTLNQYLTLHYAVVINISIEYHKEK